MREILPVFEIVPLQAIDSGLVRPRAKIVLSLNWLVDESEPREVVPEIYAELDLFDPPKHVRHLEACCEAKLKEGRHAIYLSQSRLAATCPETRQTCCKFTLHAGPPNQK